MTKTSKLVSIFIVVLLLVNTNITLASVLTTTFTRSLTIGSTGPDVLSLQQFLITGGFLKTTKPTNYFGSLTKAAVIKWQLSKGILPAVGFFGPLSRAKINVVTDITSTTSVAVTNIELGLPASIIVNNPNGLPVHFMISKLNINAGFQYNGLTTDGTIDIPSNVVDVGWFAGSVHPGEIGTSIITGHVAQIHGGVVTKQGVFYHLNELIPGDKISILNDKGELLNFVVRESRSYDPKANATDVFISKDNGAHLNIITCEGTWNPGQLSYSQRLVVFTDLVK